MKWKTSIATSTDVNMGVAELRREAAMMWYRCANGGTPELLDLLHVLLYPQSDVQVDTPLGYCHYPKIYNLSRVWSLFPEETNLFIPKHFVDSFTAMLVAAFPLTLILVLVRYVWDRADSHFSSINPSHKKWYVMANLSKAFFLAAIALNTSYLRELQRMFTDNFGSILLKRTLTLYMVTDIVALFLVPKLPTSTVIHHVVTFLLGVVSSLTNLQIKGYKGVLSLAKMASVYGMISCISFMVNAYLALRVVYPKSKAIKVLCFISLLSYLVCCAVNWTYQIHWFVTVLTTGEFSLYAAIYILLLIFIVNDDIVLIKWLLRQSSPMATVAQDGRKKTSIS